MAKKRGVLSKMEYEKQENLANNGDYIEDEDFEDDSPSFLEVLSKRVLYLCNQNHLAVSHAENKLFWANGTIKKLKKQMPSAYKIWELSRFFGVSTDYLLGVSESKQIVPQQTIDDWELLTEKQQGYVMGIITGLLLEGDHTQSNIERGMHKEKQKNYIRFRIDKLKEELLILDAKDKTQMKIDVRGYRK